MITWRFRVTVTTTSRKKAWTKESKTLNPVTDTQQSKPIFLKYNGGFTSNHIAGG